jgi:hypothetical protein
MKATTKDNGFVFDNAGALISEPENATLDLLKTTRESLYRQREYIKASRITQLINARVA